jgi:hypothetical protein
MDKVKVIGTKWFKGNIDGKDLDSGTVYIEERLDDRRGTAKGYAASAYKVSSSAVAQTLAKREFPLVCNVEFDRVTNGRDTETIIVDIRPADSEGAPRKAA